MIDKFKNILLVILMCMIIPLCGMSYILYHKYLNATQDAVEWKSMFNAATDSINCYKLDNGQLVFKVEQGSVSYKELQRSSNVVIKGLRDKLNKIHVTPKPGDVITDINSSASGVIVTKYDTIYMGLSDTITVDVSDKYLCGAITLTPNYGAKFSYQMQENLTCIYSIDRLPLYNGDSKFKMWWTRSLIGNIFCKKEDIPVIRVTSENPNTKITNIKSYKINE